MDTSRSPTVQRPANGRSISSHPDPERNHAHRSASSSPRGSGIEFRGVLKGEPVGHEDDVHGPWSESIADIFSIRGSRRSDLASHSVSVLAGRSGIDRSALRSRMSDQAERPLRRGSRSVLLVDSLQIACTKSRSIVLVEHRSIGLVSTTVKSGRIPMTSLVKRTVMQERTSATPFGTTGSPPKLSSLMCAASRNSTWRRLQTAHCERRRASTLLSKDGLVHTSFHDGESRTRAEGRVGWGPSGSPCRRGSIALASACVESR